MGDVIELAKRKNQRSRNSQETFTRSRKGKAPSRDRTVIMKKVSDRIDALLTECLNNDELALHELAGLLAHRLGALIKITEERAKLVELCERLISRP